jgi:cobyrinic acid a,c-diamide synthase
MDVNVACPRIVIAGTNSGVGKTSVTLALVGALRRRGLRVQTFKVGPDFLDPTYLTLASGRPCYNLDGWMTNKGYVRNLFFEKAASADVAVVEGVMGLFDGSDPVDSSGSTGEIAAWLDAPVLLVVNAHGVARSLAALVKGYAEFDPGLTIAGIVANHCGSERHGDWLKESLDAFGLPRAVATVPRGAFPELPSRHLGLVTADARNVPEQLLEALAVALERHGRLDEILGMARSAPDVLKPSGTREGPENAKRLRLGLAYDAAFHFYYQDNLEALEEHGCEIVPFSPLQDRGLPEGTDGLYFGGGYPEEYAESLAGNTTMLESVRRFAGDGKPVYAECGGLMYLAQGIECRDAGRHALVGLLPQWTRMLDRRKALSYVEVTLTRDSLLGRQGESLRGHEFHYSELFGEPTDEGKWSHPYSVKRRRSDASELEGFQRGRTVASYVHAHFASRPGAVEHFVAACGAEPRPDTHDFS